MNRLLLQGLSYSSLILSSSALTSCKPQIRDANLDAVNIRQDKAEQTTRKGLSPKEVESILGQPDDVQTATIELETQKKQVPVTRYYYKQDGQTIELHFFDNKLIHRVPHWDSTSQNQGPKANPSKQP